MSTWLEAIRSADAICSAPNLGTCKAHYAAGNCSQFVDVSLDPPVLYFVFPDSLKLLIEGRGPENVNARIDRPGLQLWSAFLIEQAAGGSAGYSPEPVGFPLGRSSYAMSRAYSARSATRRSDPGLAAWADMSRAFGAEDRSSASLPTVARTMAEVSAPGELLRSFASLRMTPFNVEASAEGNVN